jgi:DNA-binding PadR family transcriptional regulator
MDRTKRTINGDPGSKLGFALLGLIWQSPRSGYELRKFFSATPMMSFSDSPGAIYPALRNLEKRGLIRGRAEGPRRRKVFQLAPRGRAEFRRWQTQPVTRADIVRNCDALLLRFAFMDQSATRSDCLRFLESFHEELAAYLPTLRKYLKASKPHMPLSGALALENGIRGYEAHLRWAATAIKIYRRGKGENS